MYTEVNNAKIDSFRETKPSQHLHEKTCNQYIGITSGENKEIRNFMRTVNLTIHS